MILRGIAKSPVDSRILIAGPLINVNGARRRDRCPIFAVSAARPGGESREPFPPIFWLRSGEQLDDCADGSLVIVNDHKVLHRIE
jgi:hypothetical protein